MVADTTIDLATTMTMAVAIVAEADGSETIAPPGAAHARRLRNLSAVHVAATSTD